MHAHGFVVFKGRLLLHARRYLSGNALALSKITDDWGYPPKCSGKERQESGEDCKPQWTISHYVYRRENPSLSVSLWRLPMFIVLCRHPPGGQYNKRWEAKKSGSERRTRAQGGVGLLRLNTCCRIFGWGQIPALNDYRWYWWRWTAMMARNRTNNVAIVQTPLRHKQRH